MLVPGSQIVVQLPGIERDVPATVIRCSTAGRSCLLHLDDSNEEISVNITKCKYSVVHKGPPSIAADLDIDDDHRGILAEESRDSDEDAESEDAAEELDLFRQLDIPCDNLQCLVNTVTANASAFSRPSEALGTVSKDALLEIIEYAAKLGQNSSGTTFTPPPMALYVDGFDAEQIWLQLDMLTVPALKRVRKQLRKTEGISSLVTTEVEEALDDLLAGDNGEQQEGSDDGLSTDDEDDLNEDDDEDEDGVDYDAMLSAGFEGGPLSDDLDEEVSDDTDTNDPACQLHKSGNLKNKRRRLTPSEARAVVEDEYFKLDDMEAFLEQAEREYVAGSDDEKPRNKNKKEYAGDSDSGLDDEALNGFGGRGSAEDDDSDAIEAELEGLLDNAAGLVGRKVNRKNKSRKQAGFGSTDESTSGDDSADSLSDDDDSEGMANARYEDFFGPKSDGKDDATGLLKRKEALGRSAIKKRSVLAEDPTGSSDAEDEPLDSEQDDDASTDDEPLDNGNEETGLDRRDAQQSTHQRRLEKTAAKVRQLEAEAMEERPWFLQGEVTAGNRPKNSALEIDLDFETTVAPPPAPTEDSTRSLEDLIKARIADGRYDDPLKLVPHAIKKTKTTVELDDKKSTAGLGELYEKDYVAAVTGTAEDRDEPVRELAKAQFMSLCAKLDALSHGHYRPTPSMEEVAVKLDVPAILMEEAAPAFVSAASMRAPTEVYRAGTGAISKGAISVEDRGEASLPDKLPVVLQSGGGIKSEAELTREDRKRRRAAKKRASKNKSASIEADRAAKAAIKGDTFVPNRKSEAAEVQLRKMAKAAKQSGGGVKFDKSASLFAKIQQIGEAGSAREPAVSGVRATRLKL